MRELFVSKQWLWVAHIFSALTAQAITFHSHTETVVQFPVSELEASFGGNPMEKGWRKIRQVIPHRN
ncbi:hypothetical protein BT96DRAFT_133012 [Gymnopus androsaceus JB14]|uniref:Secreted protein n=1 Tax=Gymnopus androsaceus JB14 TaxID=1447944 RepID=A0A6A4IEE5_9AGAR|nr:hypothetical protein BT96DRAFT_133012 [Gymnopus androsaceus JB14]